MVFFQILLGGITRLTGSGLSITQWEIVTGTLPPLNEREWNEAFDLYQATPQFKKINEGISLSQFKFIFFWEYLHRLWARLMGLVFIIPFVFFLLRKSIDRVLLMRLLIVVLLASMAAIFGWIMVASGLVNRPWVNAYKLSLHLGLGIALFVFLFATWLSYKGFERIEQTGPPSKNLKLLILLITIQLAFGGMLSGMKAAINYPTWPLMNGSYIPDIITTADNWSIDNFLLYDQTGFMAALVQFMHRNLGYLLFIMIVFFAVNWLKKLNRKWSWTSYVLLGIIVVQVLLGILTLLNSTGSIPLLLGVLHQAIGIILFTFTIYLYMISRSLNNHLI